MFGIGDRLALAEPVAPYSNQSATPADRFDVCQSPNEGLCDGVAFTYHERMNVTFRCPSCERSGRTDLSAGDAAVLCPYCDWSSPIPADSVEDNHVKACAVCPSTELYVRKDFSQRLGVTIIVLGFVASSIAWFNYQIITTYAILFATALFDVVLYLRVGNVLQCYRCHSEYRGLDGLDEFEPFNLETHERYRQQKARLGEE